MSSVPQNDIQSAMTHLESLSDEELQNLIADEDSLDKFITSLPLVKRWDAEKETMMAMNRSIAEYNLSFEPKLREGKAELMEQYEKARALCDELETKRGQLESLNSRTSLDTTYALLQTAAAQAEEESEAVAEKFVDGSMDVDTFMKQYTPLKITAHMRKMKSEKMGEIVAAQRNRSSFSAAAPYPTSSMMPMPIPPR